MTAIHPRRRWASLLVAATLLTAATAPASAAFHGVDAPRSGFHHHFYRGVPGQNRVHADMTDVAADAGAQEEAEMAYCADRFKSYDPSTGTYLGYDGAEHACP